MTTTQQQIAHVELLLRNIQSMKHVDAKKEFVRTHTMATTSLLTATPHHTDTIVIVPTPKRQDNNSATSKSSPPKSTSPFSKSSLSPNKHHQHHQHNSPPIMSTPPPYPKTTKQKQQVQPSSPDFSASVQSLASQIRNPDSQKELINFMKRLVDREHHHKNKAKKGKPLATLSLEVLSDSLNYIDLIEGSQIFSSELIRKIYDATVRYSKDCASSVFPHGRPSEFFFQCLRDAI
eukprot:PhF_6_TR37452/c0_g1_i1/m.55072